MGLDYFLPTILFIKSINKNHLIKQFLSFGVLKKPNIFRNCVFLQHCSTKQKYSRFLDFLSEKIIEPGSCTNQIKIKSNSIEVRNVIIIVTNKSPKTVRDIAIINLKLEINDNIKIKSMISIKHSQRDVDYDTLIPIVRAPMGIQESKIIKIRKSKHLKYYVSP